MPQTRTFADALFAFQNNNGVGLTAVTYGLQKVPA